MSGSPPSVALPESGDGSEAVDVLETSAAGPAAIRGSALRTGGYGLAMLASLASAPLLVRHLGVAEFGRFAAVQSLIAVVGGVTDAGLSSIALREYAVMKGEERDALMRNLIGFRLVLTLVGVAAATGFSFAAYGPTLALGTLLAGLGFTVYIVQSMYATALTATLRLGWVTAADVVRQVGASILTIGLVFAGSGVVGFLGVTIPAGLAAVALTAWLVRGVMPLRPAFHLGAWRSLISDTLAIAAAVALNNFYFRIVILVMSLIASALTTGYFATSFRVIEILVGVPFLVITGLVPLLSKAAGDPQRMRYIAHRMFDAALIVGAGMATITAVGARVAIDVLAGAKAEPAVGVLRVQAVALGIVCLTVTWQAMLFALRMHRQLMLSNAFALVLTLALTIVLVPLDGARGGAIAVVCGETFLQGISFVFIAARRPELRPPGRIVPRVAAAVGLAVAVYVVAPGTEVPRVLLATAAYAAAIVALRALPPEVPDAVTGWIRARRAVRA